MLTVYNCLVYEHDLRLVGLAVVVCAFASFTAISLLDHVRKSNGPSLYLWLAVSATATGFGIWATHFIAMLAFTPGIASGYNIVLTILSLFAAILLTGVGLATSLSARLPRAAWLGGAIVGGGIATMHYTGMAAFEVEGRIVWDPALVKISIALGALIGATSLPTALRQGGVKWKFFGALLLTIAIASHHFAAMGAVSIIPDPTIEISRMALPTGWLAIGVAFASLGIMLLAFTALALDLRDRRRAAMETIRMRDLANAAVEGLLVCERDTIVTANNSFVALMDSHVDQIVGTKLEKYFVESGILPRLFAQSNEPLETELRRADGSALPVELIVRPVDFAGRPHQAIAVRDLRRRKKAEQHIRYLAHHDALTGLPNRSSFAQQLDKEIDVAVVTGERLAVLCLDLDRFKEVNDLFGHAAGDAMLQTVASCVGGILEPKQMLARLGGDEFAIILPHVSSPAVAGRIAENILETLKAHNEAAATGALLSSSIGIAVCPNDGTDRQSLLKHADTALYRAKADGRRTYRFFEASMGEEVRDRRLLEHDLRYAVGGQELSLVYQAQKDLKTETIIGFEALLRWQHQTRGNVPPSVFIPIAEESGAILQIGEWVLRTACREAATWTQPLSVAVNVSAVQLHNSGFAQLIHEILFRTGLAPQRLELEITETALIRDLNRALSTLRQLKALGVRIAMDDFGTGYSSLSNLRAFPFDKIKIDGSFIKSVNTSEQAATIVRAVLGLGRGLGLPVLAEGVETSGELKFLVEEHCDEAQGYHLGRPTPIDQLRHLTHPDTAVDASQGQSPPQNRVA